MKNFIFLIFFFLGIMSCSSPPQNDSVDTSHIKTILDVKTKYFKSANPDTKITIVDCTLSDRTKTKCFQIITNSTPKDHPMGPWCPTNISDDASAGGIWLEGGKVYDVDGAFVKNMATLYKDDTWKMYDDDGNIKVTKTMEDCVNAANPNVGEEYKNFCVECLPSYITDVSRTWTIPISPVFQGNPASYSSGRGSRPDGPPPGGKKPPNGPRPGKGAGGVPATRGIALNGVEYSAPAPVNNILSAYTLAPFDDAGGHINVHQGYHYHTATGMSFSVEQTDKHPPLIGYAMDGHGIYALLDTKEKEPTDLDECRGHYDEVRGYHYHVDAAGNNNFINCLHGAYATN